MAISDTKMTMDTRRSKVDESANVITLLVPTMNRPEFLIRLLNYYSNVGFEGTISIGDSSEPDHVKRILNVLDGFRDRLNIRYQECPGLSDSLCLQQLVEQANTRYAAYVADDDFLIPSGLAECARFLENHSDYSAAHGIGVLMNTYSGDAHGDIAGVGIYQQPIIEDETASQRLVNYLNFYTTSLFSVHRIETWREMFKSTSLMSDRSFAGELMPSCLSVIHGKVKELDHLYLVRQVHERRYALPDAMGWLSSSDWLPAYQTFHDRICEELIKRDRIGLEQSQAVVKQAFAAYLNRFIRNSLEKPPVKSCHSPLTSPRALATRIPVLSSGLRQLRSFLPNKTGKLSYPALMRQLSPYHADFLPVYQAITDCSAISEPPEVHATLKQS